MTETREVLGGQLPHVSENFVQNQTIKGFL